MTADKSPGRDDALARELANAALMLADALAVVAPRLRVLVRRDWAAAATATCSLPASPIADITADMSAAASRRFWRQVDKGEPNACWLWKGSVRTKGYGRFSLNARTVSAHRFAYEDAVGRIPPGLLIRHVCDVPGCVNPAHLTPGTYKDNAEDRVRRKRQARGEHMPHAKLDAGKVREIRRSQEPGGVLAERFQVTLQTIYDVRKGHTWQWVDADAPAAGEP